MKYVQKYNIGYEIKSVINDITPYHYWILALIIKRKQEMNSIEINH